MITFRARTASGEIINSVATAFTFPAGEAHTKIDTLRSVEPTEIAIIQPSKDSMHDDLFQLAMWNDVMIQEDVERVLVMPYAPGARADRGLPLGVAIYADFIQWMGLDQVIIFDPHSAATVDSLNYGSDTEVTVLSSDDLVKKNHNLFSQQYYSGIIAPDKGAVGRAQSVADVLDIPVFLAEKTRDFETGKLTGFSIEELPANGSFLIVDDICDGGGTFLGLAEASGLRKEQLDLFVSHGVFSKNALQALPEKFGHIITTNSYDPQRLLRAEGAAHTYIRMDVVRLMLERILVW